MKISGIIKYIVAIAVGLFISAVDNYADGGEISPIFIIILLLLACTAISLIVNSNAYILSIIIWFFIPAIHLIKHFFGLSDTIQPNTYQSILLLALLTFIISQIGFLSGRGVRKTMMND